MKQQLFSWLALGSLTCPFYGQEFRSFVGTTNTVWESPSNWNPNLVPDSISEGARLDNGATVIVGGSHLISALEITAGGGVAMNQSNVLRTSTLSISAAGTMSGPGTLQVEQAGFISDGSGVNFSNILFRNNGTLDLFNGISLSADTVFQNANTTNLADGSMIGVGSGGGQPGRIENTGFIRKTAGSGSATLSVPIANELEIASLAGLLNLTGQIDSSSTGRLRTEPGGTIALFGGATFANGSQILGAGETVLSTGTLAIPSGAAVNFEGFRQSGGLIDGAGILTHNGTNNILRFGTLGGSVTSRVPGGSVLTVEGQGNGISAQGTHEIHVQPGGKLRFLDDNSRITSNGMTSFLNEGTLTFDADGDLSQNGSDLSNLMTFVNAASGKVVKSAGVGSSNPTQMVVSVTSSGEWEVQDGKMQFSRLADFSAPIEIATGAEVEFTGSSGFGGTILRQGAGFTGGGLVEFDSPTEIVAGAVVDTGKMILDNSLFGDGSLRIAESGVWGIGNLDGNITLEILPGARLDADGSGGRSFNTGSQPKIINGGIFALSGTAKISSNGSPTLENGGALTLSGSSAFTTNSGTNLKFVNTGSFRKDDGGLTGSNAFSSCQIDLTHHGVMEVLSGTLVLNGEQNFHAPVSIASGGILRVDANQAAFHAGSAMQGEGEFHHRGGEVTIAAGATVPFSNYSTPFGSGLVTGEGTIVLSDDTPQFEWTIAKLGPPESQVASW